MKMAMLTVRNLPDEVHRALRVRAARHGHSMKAEVREILESAASPEGRVWLGSLLADMGRHGPTLFRSGERSTQSTLTPGCLRMPRSKVALNSQPS